MNLNDKKACMVVFSFYPADPRVRREAEALAEAGMGVDVVCLKGPVEESTETVNGVNVSRINIKKRRGGKLSYVWEYSAFILLAFLMTSWLHIKRNYKIVHVHNMPDILVVAALLPKLTGSKVILDLHDPMPEVYMTKYEIGPTHPVIRALIFLERWCIRFADVVLTPNLAFRNLFISRGCNERKINIVMNSPQESIFHKRSSEVRGNNAFVLMYHGTIVERHGLDTALKALCQVREEVPGVVFHVCGDGDSFLGTFLGLIDDLGLNEVVQYHGRLPLEKIAELIETIDVGVIPNKRTCFTEINFPTRIFEYLAMGKQVIAPRTRGILDYFDEGSMNYFEPESVEDLAKTILRVYSKPSESRMTLDKGLNVYQGHCWELQKRKVVDIAAGLLS